jgi:glucose/arabinose dehydrogenase
MMKVLAVCILLLLGITEAACNSRVETEELPEDGFQIVTVANNLDHPWSLAFLPEGGYLVTERKGSLLMISADGKSRKRITGLPPIAAATQGGLLDIILAPDYRSSRTVFFSFSASGRGGTGTEIARAQLAGTALTSVHIIFRAEPKTSSNLHYGSRLLFAPDGTLYITLGEKFDMKQAQNPSTHPGSVIRINPDGTVPEDNPFRRMPGYKPEIYTLGHRNVQGIMLNPVTGDIWIHEHGPMGGDEINILKSGKNYGWPLVTYGIDYSGAIISDKTDAPGFEPPLLYWKPSIAPSGMTWYDGDKFPQWKGNVFVGSLVQRHLRRLVIRDSQVVRQEKLLEELGERIRDVRTGPDGYLYLLTDSSSGRLLRLEPLENTE